MKQLLTSKLGVVGLIVVALGLLSGTVLAAGGIEISRHVIGGGGGHSAMGHYVLDATVGQAVVGTFNAPPDELCAGFWCGLGEYNVYLPVIMRN
ncbi:hypothetical protein TFLX_05973 [Thermoflexales bacterium]|nr:hypothetical protein TFLX_05973 [Thermoflexales bacterium]